MAANNHGHILGIIFWWKYINGDKAIKYDYLGEKREDAPQNFESSNQKIQKLILKK
jgi:hypothetical protein